MTDAEQPPPTPEPEDSRLELIAAVLRHAGIGGEIAERAAADVITLIDNRDIAISLPWTAGCLMGSLLRDEAMRLTDRQIADSTGLSEATVVSIRHDWGVNHR